MTSQLVTKGKATWVGSGAPKKSRVEPRLLKARSGGAYIFDKHPTPVPYGDTVGVGKLRFWVARDFAGTVTLKARRVASRPDWGDLDWPGPGVTGSSQPTVTLVNPTRGTLVEFNVATHLQTIANGGGKEPHYGWRIESDNTNAILLWGFDSDSPPELYVEYSNIPGTPTDLTSGKVSTTKPVLAFTAPDLTGEDDITALHVQIDPASNAVTPAFDSSWKDALAPELRLADTAFAGLTGPTFWRVQWKNSSSVESAWSDWYPIEYLARPVISITNPPVSGLVTDVTPELIATVDKAIDAYRIRVVDPADPKKVYATSGKKQATGTTFAWTPTKALQERGYVAQFDVWDTEDRADTADEPAYTRATRAFSIDQDATVVAPTIVAVRQVGNSPTIEVEFTIPETPDSFTAYDNGKVVDSGIEPVDTLVTGTTYVWRWSGSAPEVPHSFRLRAVKNKKQSPKSNALSITPQVDGIWIVDAPLDLAFVIGGNDTSSWRRTDQVGAYQVLGGSEINVFSGDNGLAGSCSGPMRARPQMGLTLEDLEADLDAIEANKGRPVRLVLGDMSIPVVLRHLSCTPHPDHNRGAPRRLVSFEFTEDR